MIFLNQTYFKAEHLKLISKKMLFLKKKLVIEKNEKMSFLNISEYYRIETNRSMPCAKKLTILIKILFSENRKNHSSFRIFTLSNNYKTFWPPTQSALILVPCFIFTAVFIKNERILDKNGTNIDGEL